MARPQHQERRVTDRILNVDQVAELVQLSTKTVMRAIAAGDLEASQLTQGRGGWRIRESAIEQWMDNRSNRRREPRAPVDVDRIEPETAIRPATRAPRRGSGGRLVVTADMGRRAA